MAPILPETIDFGDPGFDIFPDLIPIEAEDVDTSSTPLPEDEQPFGIDIYFDFVEGDFALTASGDFRYTTERRGLEQWVSAALLTPRGEDLIYSSQFGTTLGHMIHDIHESGANSALKRDIEEALFQHDRIDDIHAFALDIQNELATISFDVITDDARVLVFEGIQVAR